MHAYHGSDSTIPGDPPPPGAVQGLQVRHRARARLSARDRRRGAQLLEAALIQGGLRLRRTTRCRLADLAPVAEEVTLRWPHCGLSAAAALVSAGSGEVSLRIGQWILRQSCGIAAGLPAATVLSLPVPNALLQEGISRDVAAALAQYGVAPGRLELRVSEVGLLEPTTEQLLALSALRDRGVRLALEDFGLRHASVALLRRLPLTAVHLAPGLTHDLSPGSEDSFVVAGLVAIAHALGLNVVARIGEGSDRLEALRRVGADEGVRPAEQADLRAYTAG
jgi:EAL domain-containing protein (putative c-di-GMP-specific phosphodiesterase class I)